MSGQLADSTAERLTLEVDAATAKALRLIASAQGRTVQAIVLDSLRADLFGRRDSPQTREGNTHHA